MRSRMAHVTKRVSACRAAPVQEIFEDPRGKQWATRSRLSLPPWSLAKSMLEEWAGHVTGPVWQC